MRARMFAALVIFAFACLAVRADVVIQIIRDDNKLPLANAKVVIEPIDKDGKIIDQGRTDANGIFISRSLPGKFAKAAITVYPPVGLQAVSEDHDVKEKGPITIRLKKKPR